MAFPDPYKALGLSRTASQEEIKNAYRSLAKKFHPDLNPGNKRASTRFQEINAAYEILGEPEKRAKFDRGGWEEAPGAGAQGGWQGGPFRHQARPQAGGGRHDFEFGAGASPEDIFEQIFGARARAERAAEGQGYGSFRSAGGDEHYRMEVSLQEAVSGGERELTLPGGKRLRVKIPAGVADGTRLRFAGQGGGGVGGGGPGDVYVELSLAEDPRFRREGEDLLYELGVPLATAVLGGEARVPTAEGEVLLKVPRHSNTGRRLRVPGRGLFARGSRQRGDLIVLLRVVLPEAIDAELEQAIRAWQARHPEAGK